VTLIGSGFANDADSSCRFATAASLGAFTQVEYVTDSQVVCITPESEAVGAVDVEIANNGLDFSTNGNKFLFRAAESVSTLAPSEGPTTGGISVTVSGSNFFFSSDLVCQFGSIVAPATYISDTSISCVAPASSAGKAIVEVSNNRVDFTNDGQEFEFYQSMIVTGVVPLFAAVTGGAQVTLSGQPFTARRVAPSCRFGSDVTAAEYMGATCTVYLGTVCAGWNATSITCVTPKHDAGAVEVEFSLDGGQNYQKTGYVLIFRNLDTIDRLSPSRGPERGGTSVTVVGLSFVDLPDTAVCKFGSVIEPVVSFLNSTTILCVSPTCSIETLCRSGVKVFVSSNGQDWSLPAAGVDFMYTTPTSILAISPTSGSTAGTTRVVVTGSNFIGISGECLFGDVPVPATPETSSTIACLSPQNGEGSVTFEIREDGSESTYSGLTFLYTAPLYLRDLQPSQGPTMGQTRLAITGANFLSLDLQCKIGETIVAGSLVTSSMMHCTTVANPEAVVPVHISNNKADFVSNNNYFSFEAPVLLRRASVTRGPETGQNLITIFGENFKNSPSLACRFDDATTKTHMPAKFVTNSQIRCSAPSHAPAVVKIFVTVNGADYSTQHIDYQYDSLLRLYSVQPSYGSTRGGMTVTVYGHEFVGSSDTNLGCRFGSVAIRAKYLTSTSISCLSPAQTAGPVQFTAANNAHDFSPDTLSFTVLEDASVMAISPSQGPVLGGTVISIQGNGFTQKIAMCCFDSSLCQFGQVVNSYLMLCTSGPHAAGTAPLEVWGNAVSSSSFSFVFKMAPTVVSILPSSGPEDGDTIITISGAGFDRSHMLSCRFGCCTAVTARYESSTIVHCTTPAATPGMQALEVSNDGSEFSSAGILFEVMEQPVVIDIFPSSGPSGASIAVTISGLHFTTSIIGCVFEDMGQTSALLMTSTQIACLTPISGLGGLKQVQLVDVGSSVVDGGALFDFQRGPVVTALSPNIVYGDGGYRVSIFGTSFDSSLNFCRIGSAVSPTERISSTLITCLTPKAQSGVVHLEVGSASIPSVLSTELLVQELPILSRVTPSVSADLGGVVVTVNGLNFVDTKTIGCKFGDESVISANFITSSLIWCVTPPHMPGVAILQITNNGLDYSRSTLKFQFDVSVTIGSISPSRGPTLGGTVVSLVGANYDSDDQILCSFGDVGTVTSSFQRDASTVCISQPRAMPGPIDLTITAGSQVQKFVFDYFQALDLHTVEPLSGPTSGGYDIHVVADFRDFSNLVLDCRFEGTFRSRARKISPTELVCQSPAHEVGLVSVELITEDNVPIATFFHRYVKGFTVNSFEPYSASETGGTIVTIRGNFPSAQCYCMFGNSAPQSCEGITDAIITCRTVSHAAKTVLLRVSPDRSVWTNVGTFQFLQRTTLTGVSPERGACDGATTATLSGSGFTPNGAYSCVFDSVGSTMPKATYVSASTLRVSIPSLALGTYHLTVEGAYSSTKVRFTCIETPQVTRIVPSFGSLRGGTLVRVQGKNFDEGMTCKFGDIEFSASLISTTELGCLSPRMTGTAEAVVVEVGMRGAEPSSLDFTKKIGVSVQPCCDHWCLDSNERIYPDRRADCDCGWSSF
jgi:hypothetical protein